MRIRSTGTPRGLWGTQTSTAEAISCLHLSLSPAVVFADEFSTERAVNCEDATAPRRSAKLNPLMGTGNSATSNNMKLVHWPLMGGLLHSVQR